MRSQECDSTPDVIRQILPQVRSSRTSATTMKGLLVFLAATILRASCSHLPNEQSEIPHGHTEFEEAQGNVRDSMRLFGHDVEIATQRRQRRFPPPTRERTRIPRVFGVDLDPFADLAIGENGPTIVRDDPYTDSLARPHEDAPLSAAQRQAMMEKSFKKYRFGVLDPDNETIQPVSIHRGHGAEYYIGNPHPYNVKLIQKRIDERWPPGVDLSPEEQYKKDMTLKTVEVATKAMKYLLSSETNGIIHEPSGKIYLNTGAAGSTRDGPIKEVFEKYGLGQLPKMRYTADRAHFKQSLMKKISRRQHNTSDTDGGDSRRLSFEGLSTRTLDEETSSEEEAEDQEQTSVRRRRPHEQTENVEDAAPVRRRGRGRRQLAQD